MTSKSLLCLVSMVGLMLGAQSALAASAAVREMAGIMAHLEHYPSDAEKAKLKGIVISKDSTEQERVLASAISHFKHNVDTKDVDKLKKVMGDAAAPAEVRDLAGIVLSISHMPSAEDKIKLENIMK